MVYWKPRPKKDLHQIKVPVCLQISSLWTLIDYSFSLFVVNFRNASFLNRMTKLIKAPNKAYVDLTVSFEGEGDDDLPGPPVRYYFGS